MRKKRWPLRVIIRYTLFQIPEILLLGVVLYGLYIWFSVPMWMLVTIMGIWIAKDFIWFFFIWRVYEIPRSDKDPRLEGEVGVVIEPLNPQGYVKIRGELWKAKSEGDISIQVNAKVDVVDHKGLVLIVRPHRKTSAQDARKS
jgi:membrane-bound ClpP family serine protease